MPQSEPVLLRPNDRHRRRGGKDAQTKPPSMSQMGQSRPMQPVAGSCPLRSISDLHRALPRNDVMGQ
jgi:hypothetical protein